MKVKESEVAQSCPTLWDPMDCSPSGSAIHGILQARVLEWVAISFSRSSSQPMDWTRVSCIVGRCFTISATTEVQPQAKFILIHCFILLRRVRLMKALLYIYTFNWWWLLWLFLIRDFQEKAVMKILVQNFWNSKFQRIFITAFSWKSRIEFLVIE